MSSDAVRHPSLFEVNIRVLVNSYSTPDRRATLKDIPDSYWQRLAEVPVHWVWLVGVWQLKEREIQGEVIPEQMMQEFREIMPDLDPDRDIDGSTFAIDDYVVDPVLGGEQELRDVKEKLNALGLCLMLDFVPNHFGAHTHWLRTHPEYFIEVGETASNLDPVTFYSPLTMTNKYFAHGKDPYFDAWQDTVQIDYSFDGTREWMTQQLATVATLCDGVRCDMAMLPVKRIFNQTWGNYVTWSGDEFWPSAIATVKEQNPDFMLLAEVYWNMEAELLDAGFDYCYDKTFYDRLVDAESLKAHFNADTWYLERTARFLENHDEQRIAARFGIRQHMAAAALVAFSPGLRFWHMGQWLGRAVKLPVQLNRAPAESCGCLLWADTTDHCRCIAQFYSVLLKLSNRDILRQGTWEQIHTPQDTATKIFFWRWQHEGEELLVVINYSDQFFTMDFPELEMDSEVFATRIFPPVLPGTRFRKSLAPWDVRLYTRSIEG